MAKSYFAILGVLSGASRYEIRSAYRRLAKEYHPDHFTGGNGPFQKIQEAYSVLGDAGKRNEYEQSLIPSSRRRSPVQRPYAEPEPLIPNPGPVDRGELSLMRSFQTVRPSLEEIFDWVHNNFSAIDRPKSGRLQNLTLEVPLTGEQALRGGNARIMVPARSPCPICRGQGGVGFYPCSRCAGEGAISGEVPIAVSFPANLRRDHALLISLERIGIRNLQLTVLFRIIDNAW